MLAVTLLVAFLPTSAAAKPNFLFMREPWPPVLSPFLPRGSERASMLLLEEHGSHLRCAQWRTTGGGATSAHTGRRAPSACRAPTRAPRTSTPSVRVASLPRTQHHLSPPEPRRPLCGSPPCPPPSTTSHPRRRRSAQRHALHGLPHGPGLLRPEPDGVHDGQVPAGPQRELQLGRRPL